MDFGVAKKFGAGTTVTAAGQVIGTPEYMSPEQAQGQKIDFRSDVYALGILIFELFSGRVPFRGDTPISTILKHINDPPPLSGPQAKMIPAGVLPILRKALAKKPAERHSTAGDVAKALRRARAVPRGREASPTVVEEAPTVVRQSRPVIDSSTVVRHEAVTRSKRPYLWMGALALLGVAAVGGYLVYLNLGSEPQGGESQAALGSLPSAPPTAEVAPTTIPSSVSTPSTVPATTIPAPTSSVRPTTTIRPASTSVARPTTTVMPRTTSVVSTSVLPTTSVIPTTAGGIGLLQIGVIPWGEITVDGELIGTTPLDRFPLSAGTHTVRIRHPDFEPVEREITIRPDETEKLVVNLSEEGKRIK
jgi:serine/threonine-protein kinase